MLNLSRRQLVAGSAALAAGRLRASPPAPVQPTWESLSQHFRSPDWFRDAKLGLWAHWGPQCVPEWGDWYARKMYQQGSPFYEHHLKTYGHPSRHGFIDFIGQWRADKWDPQRLVQRFKQAGAKYVVAMANHHDNFDLWDSRYHPWNSTRIGPKRNIVGGWERAVRAEGLRFGLSNHSAHAWHWMQAAYGYDPEGPMKGVRYDAFRLRKADGRGKFWQGLDPQALYTGPSMVPPDGIGSIKAMDEWHVANDRHWWETVPKANPGFAPNWLARQLDLVRRYRPDLVYFDNEGLPLEQFGLDATAQFYNQAIGTEGLQGVVTGKKLSPDQRKAITEDVERGFAPDIRREPWQTCTCLGDWHYDRKIYESRSYKCAPQVIQRLLDVVSKNRNLLLSVPIRGDGSIDSEEEAVLDGMAGWLSANGAAIYGSRP
jgi:alpha-L-fucosidase